MDALTRNGRVSTSKIIKEGGYQPVGDPGPVPAALIRRTVDEPLAEQPPTWEIEDLSQVAKALAHPDRVRILAELTEQETSPMEVARNLDMGLSQVSYHFKKLKDYGVIKLVRTEPHRGAVEHFYRANAEEALFGAQALIAESARKIAPGDRGTSKRAL